MPLPLRSFALRHLILELHYIVRWGLFPKNSLTPCGEKKIDWGHDLAVSKYKVDMIFIIFRE